MILILQQRTGPVLLGVLTFLLAADKADAQCKSGPQRPQNNVGRQNVSQQQRWQQMLLQQQSQLTSLVGLQQQNGSVGLQQPLAQNLSLIALRQQRQQNSNLIALERKQRNTTQSFQTGRLTGFATAMEEQQFVNALQVALDQTQSLLSMLEQQNSVANQNAWTNTLQQQAASLTDLSRQYSE
jgi:hypothetical protein